MRYHLTSLLMSTVAQQRTKRLTCKKSLSRELDKFRFTFAQQHFRIFYVDLITNVSPIIANTILNSNEPRSGENATKLYLHSSLLFYIRTRL